jgi:hypothetical protein
MLSSRHISRMIVSVLTESALKLSGLKTKREVIEEGLRLLMQANSQKAINGFRGKLKWSGDLDAMRSGK